jgi:hypothetical protein
MGAGGADFGMSRGTTEFSDYYYSKGGALPIRWCAIEALESRRFSTKTDVWSVPCLFGGRRRATGLETVCWSVVG